MKVAVLSDIHGNYHAFKTCVDYALSQSINTFIFLGDYLGELAYPQKTMDYLYEINHKYTCYFVKGNKEDYWLKYRKSNNKNWKKYDSTTGSLLYVYNNLREKDFYFFENMVHSKNIVINGLPITICHGSPDKVNEKMLSDNKRTFEIMDSVENNLILCGHSHIQEKIVYKDKVVLNAGSVGLSINSDGKSQFLILDINSDKNGITCWREEFVSLDYDVDQVIYELYEDGLNEYAPYWCYVTEKLLKDGKISHAHVLNKAMVLCKEDKGDCIWPDIPEKYWAEAWKVYKNM